MLASYSFRYMYVYNILCTCLFTCSISACNYTHTLLCATPGSSSETWVPLPELVPTEISVQHKNTIRKSNDHEFITMQYLSYPITLLRVKWSYDEPISILHEPWWPLARSLFLDWTFQKVSAKQHAQQAAHKANKQQSAAFDPWEWDMLKKDRYHVAEKHHLVRWIGKWGEYFWYRSVQHALE